MTRESMPQREETEIKISLKQIGMIFVFGLRQYSVLCAEYFEVDAFPNKVIERPSTSTSRRLLTNQKLQKTKKIVTPLAGRSPG